MNIEKMYQEDKIMNLLSDMGSIFYELGLMYQYQSEEDKKSIEYIEKESDLEDDYVNKVNLIFKTILVYLESNNNHRYLEDFKKEFEPRLANRKLLLETDFDDISGELYSKTTAKIWEFLFPFEFINKRYQNKLNERLGLIYLENILSATQRIVNKSNKQPTTEAGVYNEVKFVIKTIFPSAISASSNFFTCFKKYKPDILIPELKVAIEYKYARSETDLKNQMGEIAEDSVVYTGDTNYEIFIAVFYVIEDFWGKKIFEKSWEDMNYPENWRPIYVIGKDYRK